MEVSQTESPRGESAHALSGGEVCALRLAAYRAHRRGGNVSRQPGEDNPERTSLRGRPPRTSAELPVSAPTSPIRPRVLVHQPPFRSDQLKCGWSSYCAGLRGDRGRQCCSRLHLARWSWLESDAFRTSRAEYQHLVCMGIHPPLFDALSAKGERLMQCCVV